MNHLASESRTLSSSSTISNLPCVILLPRFHRCAVMIAGNCGILAIHRQLNSECRTLSHGRVHFDLPAMAFHDVLADGQAQPRAAGLLRGVERLEDVREMLVGNSDRSEERRVGKECRSRW